MAQIIIRRIQVGQCMFCWLIASAVWTIGSYRLGCTFAEQSLKGG